MARYRVGEEGLRVTTASGAVYSLPPGAEIAEIPDQYDGTLEVLELDEVPPLKVVGGYADKMIRPAEDKSL
jgi:hypothetical protein